MVNPNPGTERTAAPAITDSMRAAHQQLAQLLVPDERVQATSPQIWLFALTHRRALVAATTNRFIGITRRLLGGYTPVDVRWQDLSDARLDVGIFSATLIIKASIQADLAMASVTPNLVVFRGLEKNSAQAVYRICQEQEQVWREKRRVRELEEMRARSGGIQLGATPGAAGGGDSQADVVHRLAQAKEMLDKGLISDSEYEAMKARVISSF
jgi:hypothetical protein